jgi:NADH dehydrogenase
MPESAGTPRVVIVGAGFGGLTAAQALARGPVLLTVVDRRNHHLFAPLLYQVATAALSPSQIAYPIRSILSGQKNTRVLLADATGIDLERREVTLADGSVPYDFLILAAGSRHAYFGHDEWEKNAPGLKTLEDALEIRRRILIAFEKAERETRSDRRKALLTFVLVGGGPTGVELAGAIAEIARHVLVSDFRSINPREARILLLEAGPRILPAYSDKSSRSAAKVLERRGVEVRAGSPVTGVDANGVQLGSDRVDAATVLWCAGVAASPLARSLGAPLDRAGRVQVEPDLSIPGHPEVFVVGDLALYPHQTGQPLPGVAQVAIQQGRSAARNILRDLRREPRNPFRYRDKGNMAVIGRSAAVAELAGLKVSGWLAWLMWCFIHILYLVGFRSRLVVLVEWAWAYLGNERSARLITGDIDRPRTG